MWDRLYSMAADSPDREQPPGGESEDILARLFRSGRNNAIISWLLVGVLIVVFVDSLLDYDLLWILFVASTGVIVLLPPVISRKWRVMLP